MDQMNQSCFGCGKDNPIGLHLKFIEKEDSYCSTFTPGIQHQGYDGIMHGGIVSTVLDEVMVNYLYAKGLNAVTAKLEVRYRKQTPIGKLLTITARIEGKRGNMYQLVSEITLPDGTITAEGKATVAVLEDMKHGA